MDQREKLAGDLQEVLRTSASHMTKLANQNAALLAENTQQGRQLAAYKLARRMEQRGLNPELDFEAKVAKVLEVPQEKLATLEQAIELTTGGFRLGLVQEDDKTASNEPVRADDLDAWIASQDAYTT